MAWPQVVRTLSGRRMPRPVPWPAVGLATLVHLAGLEALVAAELLGRTGVAAALLTYGTGAGLVAVQRRARLLGWANALTLGRLLGVSWIAGLTASIADATGTVLVIAIGTACLVVDGVDGKVARARGEAAPFGARFDMETDAAMLLVLSAAVALHGFAGWWVLAIGLMRYAYWATSFRVAPLRIPLPSSYARRVVAAVQGVALLLSLALGVAALPPVWLPAAVAGTALAALTWSFGRDVRWQLRR
jgi:phosphatidylglycerophosphate synthase